MVRHTNNSVICTRNQRYKFSMSKMRGETPSWTEKEISLV